MKVALDEANGKCNDLRGRLEEAEERMREMQAAHEVEKVELRDYYQNAMGQLDNNQKIEADQRIKEEEGKIMLQSSVRVVAGQLDDIKASYKDLRDLMSQLRSAFATDRSPTDMDTEVEERARGSAEEGFEGASAAIARSVVAVSGTLENAMSEVRARRDSRTVGGKWWAPCAPFSQDRLACDKHARALK
jgi:chromosome segregation ATPase